MSTIGTRHGFVLVKVVDVPEHFFDLISTMLTVILVILLITTVKIMMMMVMIVTVFSIKL